MQQPMGEDADGPVTVFVVCLRVKGSVVMTWDWEASWQAGVFLHQYLLLQRKCWMLGDASSEMNHVTFSIS